MVGLKKNWKGFWKDAGVAYSTFCPGICLQEMKKSMSNLRIVGVPAEIQTQHPRIQT
jgi:hypothetical protein